MTIGIYKLEFIDLEDWPYVGQSINIEQRYQNHCSSLERREANHMMQEAYDISGKPSLSILEILKIADLDSREQFWINKLDTVNNGLNLTSNVIRAGRGQDGFNSKISNKKIIEAMKYILLNPTKLMTEISKTLKVPLSILNGLVYGRNHGWLLEEYPEEYLEMISQSRVGLWDAEHQGISYPDILSPEGIKYKVTNVQKFSREHKISNSSLHQVLTGKRKSCSKWTLP